MRKIVILGVGMTKFGISEMNMKEMFTLAGLEALKESNIEAKDLEALFIGNVLGDFEEGQLNIAPFLASEIGMRVDAPATRFEGACASATVAIRHAALMVGSGIYDIVMAGGTERTTVMGNCSCYQGFCNGKPC